MPYFAATRLREITQMAQPYIEATDGYARAVSRVSNLLGHNQPADTQDRVIRDLLADVFDFLYEARDLIVGGKLAVAYPLARRAYESLSLLHLCTVDVTWAQKWEDGKKIGNADVRKQLGRHPLGETELELKELYDFFCTATHPNRELVAARRLGEGNEFVLGLIGMPDLFFVVDYCSKHLELWHWLTATVTYFYRDLISTQDSTYFAGYDEITQSGKDVKRWLVESLPQLHREALEIDANHGLRLAKPAPNSLQRGNEGQILINSEAQFVAASLKAKHGIK
ncbi:MAG: hypothetical protein B7X59_12745 [Polaromonas sp. 39-63-203]|nr:MAG: hypothetical protein B7Y54_13070 [Polaromonas sp. 35-63-240]OYZ81546.1 MAG: hypothetical protein B7Y03_12365 [Polaromonas sp. 24-62-144]OZA94999.1 MAG: hypothetical protein B7X59_12745 [Polaromonas sp. 39-63-203]